MIKMNKRFLNDVCQPASFDNPAKNQVLENGLLELMKKKKALGLAANQVGQNTRLFVMRTIDDKYLRCFNPVVVSHNEHYEVSTEGCLSFPGEFVEVPRLTGIKVKFQNRNGGSVEMDLYGLDARVFQHELDHLNGITMHDQIEGAV